MSRRPDASSAAPAVDSPRTTLALALRLGWMFLSSAAVRRSAVILGVVVAVTTLALTLVASADLTGEQQAERHLGRFEHTVQQADAGSGLPGTGLDPRIVERMRAAGARDVATERATIGLEIDQLPGDGLVIVREMAWSAEPFPQRFRLVEGRWPVAPGEVAVSAPTAARQPDTTMWSAFAGAGPMHQVGVVEDRYAQSADEFLLAEGTWQSWTVPDVEIRYATSGLTPAFYWNGGEPDAVVAAIVADLPGDPVANQEMTAQTLVSRDDFLDRTVSGYASSFALTSWLPAVGFPLLLAALGAALNHRWARRIGEQLEQIGITRARSLLALLLATVVSLLGAVILGIGVGGVGGILLRPVIDAVIDQPLSPVAWPPPQSGTILLAAGVGMVIGGIPFDRLPRLRLAPAHQDRIRRVVAGIAGLGIISQVRGPDTPEDFTILALCCLIAAAALAPELIQRLARRPTTVPTRLLARRMLQEGPSRPGASAMAIAVFLGITCTASGVLAVAVATSNQMQLAALPPGMVELTGAGAAVPEGVREAFEATTGLTDPVVSTYVSYDELLPTNQGRVIAVATSADAARWLGVTLSPDQQQTLDRGGALTRDDTGTLTLRQGDVTAQIPAVAVQAPRERAAGTAAVLLLDTVRAHRLEASGTDLTYTGLSPEQDQQMPTVAARAGIDRSYIRTSERPEPAALSLEQQLSSGLTGLAVLLVAFLLARGQGIALRPRMAALNALGLPGSWARSVVRHQIVVTVGAATLAATVGFTLTMVIFLLANPDFVFAVPWVSLLILLAAVCGSTALGQIAGTRKLRYIERATSGTPG